jgi:hypothetical protein
MVAITNAKSKNVEKIHVGFWNKEKATCSARVQLLVCSTKVVVVGRILPSQDLISYVDVMTNARMEMGPASRYK